MGVIAILNPVDVQLSVSESMDPYKDLSGEAVEQ